MAISFRIFPVSQNMCTRQRNDSDVVNLLLLCFIFTPCLMIITPKKMPNRTLEPENLTYWFWTVNTRPTIYSDSCSSRIIIFGIFGILPFSAISKIGTSISWMEWSCHRASLSSWISHVVSELLRFITVDVVKSNPNSGVKSANQHIHPELILAKGLRSNFVDIRHVYCVGCFSICLCSLSNVSWWCELQRIVNNWFPRNKHWWMKFFHVCLGGIYG